jgi:hypothetical protein
VKRIDSADMAEDLHGSGKDGFQDATPGIDAPTVVNAEWLNHIQEELARAVELSGLTLDGGSYEQLFTAISSPVQSVLTPAQISANTDNYAPTGYEVAAIVRVSSDAARDLTGIGPVASNRYRVKRLVNVGAFTITLRHETTSTAANRFTCPGAVDYQLAAGESALVHYDAVTNRWRILARQTFSKLEVIGATVLSTLSASSAAISICSANSFRGGIFEYTTPPLRTKYLPLRFQNVGAGDWRLVASEATLDSSVDNYAITKTGPNLQQFKMDLELPDGAEIKSVTAGVRQTAAGSLTNQIIMDMFRSTPDDDASPGLPAVTHMYRDTASGAIGDTLSFGTLSDVVDNDATQLFLRFTASDAGGADIDSVLWVKVQFIDPGPRNY